MGRRRDDDDYDDYDDDDDDYDRPRSVRKRLKKDRSGSSFMDFVLCRAMVGRMVTPIVFWVGSIAMVFHGIRSVVFTFKGQQQLAALAAQLPGVQVPGTSTWDKIVGTLYGLGIVILGPLILRIFSECVILFFNVNDTLTNIKNDLPSDD